MVIDRYIGRTILGATGLVLFVLVALFSFLSFVGELPATGTHRYGVWQAIQFVALSIPGLIYQLFPLVTLLGAVTGLGVLAGNNELTVLRAAGVSLWRIISAVMKVGALMMVVAVAMGEWLAPVLDDQANSLKSGALAQRATLKTKTGFWARDGDNYIHVREILPEGGLSGLTIYQFDGLSALRSVTVARKALYEQDLWRLYDVQRSVINHDKITTQVESESTWGSNLSPTVLGVVSVKPESLAGLDLWRYVDYLHANGLNAQRYEFALWKKLLLPLTMAAMVVLAVPFVFGPLRAVTIGQRILVAALVGVAFYLLNQTIGHLSVAYAITPLIGAIALPTLCLVLAGVMLRRVR